jgi:hypothetical protein
MPTTFPEGSTVKRTLATPSCPARIASAGYSGGSQVFGSTLGADRIWESCDASDLPSLCAAHGRGADNIEITASVAAAKPEIIRTMVIDKGD